MVSGSNSLAVQDRPAHLWKPGQSGNPSGRAKDIIGKVIRQWEADNDYPIVKVLGSILLKGVHPEVPGLRVKVSDVIRAAEILWDRGYGKAPQEVIHSEGDTHTGIFNSLPMPKLQALMKVLDGLDSPEQLEEFIRVANIPVIEGEVKDGTDRDVQGTDG